MIITKKNSRNNKNKTLKHEIQSKSEDEDDFV